LQELQSWCVAATAGAGAGACVEAVWRLSHSHRGRRQGCQLIETVPAPSGGVRVPCASLAAAAPRPSGPTAQACRHQRPTRPRCRRLRRTMTGQLSQPGTAAYRLRRTGQLSQPGTAACRMEGGGSGCARSARPRRHPRPPPRRRCDRVTWGSATASPAPVSHTGISAALRRRRRRPSSGGAGPVAA